MFFGGGAECGALSEKPELTDNEKLIPWHDRDGQFNPTPGNVVKIRLLVMNRYLSGTPVHNRT